MRLIHLSLWNSFSCLGHSVLDLEGTDISFGCSGFNSDKILLGATGFPLRASRLHWALEGYNFFDLRSKKHQERH